MWGLDFLALPKYGDLAVREMPHGWALGVFSTTFGNSLPYVQKVISTGRVPRVRVHLLWSDTHSFSDRDIPAIKKEARRWQVLQARFPNVQFELSPFCEHNIKEPDKYLDIVKGEAPDCRPVNTPLRGGLSKKYKNEIHGKLTELQGPYNFSYDGLACVDSDVEAFKKVHQNAATFFWWEPRFNGRWESNDNTPRDKRKGWPDSKLIDSVIYLSQECGKVSLPKKWLYKSHSENKGNGDPRAEKPVLIAPIKAKHVEFVATNGQVVESLRYYGTYSDGRYRYYSDEWGYQLADKAKRIQHANPIVLVRANNKTIGQVNPAFRQNEWRNAS